MQASHQRHAVGRSDEADGENADHQRPQGQGTTHRQSFDGDPNGPGLPQDLARTAECVDQEDPQPEGDEGDMP